MTENEWPDEEEAPVEALFGPGDLAQALMGLKMLGDDMYLSMQANNIGAIDNFLNAIETQVLRELIEGDGTPASAFFLQAQTQMWIFALYELLRTWRERADNMIKWRDNLVLDQMIDKYRQPLSYKHYGRERFAAQLQELKDDPRVVLALRNDLLKTERPFRWMELLRMSLAKHEVAKVKGSIAFAPGYGRINHENGSMQYEISTDFAVFDTLSRRQIANSFRSLPSMVVPTKAEAAEFRQLLKEMQALEDPFSSPSPLGGDF
ncbi:MAG: hypothetical protein JWP26_1171 [Devosia sp.]|uniref:hypothetical protein n=1 Tax=Devosia sp. TaxID=1871048 RepID=UPI00260DC9DF|nr:hypothetical protein [Devosia sp.]MDB5586201.1 hypothetical protein [Devosia sp.]